MVSPQAWTEVRVLVPQGWHELVAEALALSPCTTVAIGNASIAQDPPPPGFEAVRTFVAEADDTPGLRGDLRRSLDELGRRSGAPELERLDVRFQRLPAEDYATSWRKSWKPFRIGRVAVLPPWDERAPRAADVVLRLVPGGSFGSGRHATTRACLRALQARVRGGERVLDAGSGSGILAVTALLLGAAEALGFDVDPNAPRSGRELAAQNGVQGRCRFLHGGFDALGEPAGDFDVVLANIYSDVIQAEASGLQARLAPHGWFAFSGCPRQHRDVTLRAIEAAGLRVEREERRGRWHTFLGSRA